MKLHKVVKLHMIVKLHKIVKLHTVVNASALDNYSISATIVEHLAKLQLKGHCRVDSLIPRTLYCTVYSTYR